MSKEIKFIPHDRNAALLHDKPFVPASKAIPEWWRKTSTTFGFKEIHFDGQATNFTVKKCVPFLDALTTGYMVILQQDVIVLDGATPEIPYLNWKAKESLAVTEHSKEQIGEIQFSDFYSRHVFKWHNDWEIKTPKGYSIAFAHPPNRFDLPFMTISGIVDTDSYEIPVQFPFVIQKDFRGIIPAGTPVAHILPVKRESWESKYDSFNPEQVDIKWFNFRKSIYSRYRNFHWFKKSYK